MSDGAVGAYASRADVRTVACPACGALASQPCQGARKPRVANHVERIQAYRAMAHLRYPPSEPPSGLAEASDQPAVEVRHVRDGVFDAELRRGLAAPDDVQK